MILKLQNKEMLYTRKLNPSLNKQTNSGLLTQIIRNMQQENSITRDSKIPQNHSSSIKNVVNHYQ